MIEPPAPAKIVSWDPMDAVGILALEDGEELRFGATACSFEPGEGVECWVVAVEPDVRRPGRRRARVVNLTGAIEPSRREAAEAFVERQRTVPPPKTAPSKRDAFWDRVTSPDEGGIVWPEGASERSALAADLIGAVWVGAVEHVATEALDLLAGARPRPGDADFERLRGAAEVLATLDTEQRLAVAALVVDVARSSMFWPLVKLEALPGGKVAFHVAAQSPDGEDLGAVEVGEDLRMLFHRWMDAHADVLDGREKRQ